MNRIDHVVVGSAGLDRGVAWVAERLGVEPVPGGSHDGLGTRNALLGLGEGQYLEVLALDPAQPGTAGGLAGKVASRIEPALVGFAIAVDDLAAAVSALRTAGVTCTDPVPLSRVRPDGVRLEWEPAFLGDDDPFLIDWRDSPHPSLDLPDGGRLTSVAITTPNAAALRTVVEVLGVDVGVREGALRIDVTVDGTPLA